jgi:hypothetical protein
MINFPSSLGSALTVGTPPAATSLCSTVIAIPMILGVLVLHPKVMGESMVSALSERQQRVRRALTK